MLVEQSRGQGWEVPFRPQIVAERRRRHGGEENPAVPLLARGEQALYVEGDLQSSRELFESAYHDAERSCDAQALALAALGLGGLWVHEQRAVADAAAVQARQRHALSLLDPECTLALRLRVRLAGEADYRSGRCDSILTLLDEARLTGDPLARAEALSLAHHCVLGPQHGDLRRRLAHELIVIASRTGRRSDRLMGLLWLTLDLLLAGDPHAERYLAQLRELLARQEHLAVGFVVSAIEVMLRIRAGEFGEAEELATACAQRGLAAGDADANGWYGAQLVAIRWYQGRMAELVPMLRELVNSPTLSAVDNSYFGALSVALATAGDQRRAAGELARLRGRGLAELPPSSSWLVMLYGAVEAAHLLADAGTSAQAYTLLSPFAWVPMVASLGAACFGSAQQALGVASLTMGETDRAVEHLRAAVDDNVALRHWPAVVLSRVRLGQALALRARSGDAAVAHRELAVAARDAAALGMAVPEDTGSGPEGPVVFRRRGRAWQIDLGEESVQVEHAVGMLHLATLCAHPGQEIPAVELAAGPGLLGAMLASATSRQAVLDDLARREYRQRVSRLDAEIGDLQALGEPDRAATSIAERDWLTGQLAATTGAGGRSRRFTDDQERARIAVGKAIRRALDRITEAGPLIGAHLRATVRTGHRCSYQPG
ncbi:MAG TPA: hypothetical protein VKG45_05650 [Actinomycetes bacterium]|nr:hypothetical protein [Actinomycetes bacterium]